MIGKGRVPARASCRTTSTWRRSTAAVSTLSSREDVDVVDGGHRPVDRPRARRRSTVGHASASWTCLPSTRHRRVRPGAAAHRAGQPARQRRQVRRRRGRDPPARRPRPLPARGLGVERGPGVRARGPRPAVPAVLATAHVAGENKRGTGVGLYSAWRIVQLHNGRIRARSEPGAWAEFAFELRAAARPARMHDAQHRPRCAGTPPTQRGGALTARAADAPRGGPRSRTPHRAAGGARQRRARRGRGRRLRARRARPRTATGRPCRRGRLLAAGVGAAVLVNYAARRAGRRPAGRPRASDGAASTRASWTAASRTTGRTRTCAGCRRRSTRCAAASETSRLRYAEQAARQRRGGAPAHRPGAARRDQPDADRHAGPSGPLRQGAPGSRRAEAHRQVVTCKELLAPHHGGDQAARVRPAAGHARRLRPGADPALVHPVAPAGRGPRGRHRLRRGGLATARRDRDGALPHHPGGALERRHDTRTATKIVVRLDHQARLREPCDHRQRSRIRTRRRAHGDSQRRRRSGVGERTRRSAGRHRERGVGGRARDAPVRGHPAGGRRRTRTETT